MSEKQTSSRWAEHCNIVERIVIQGVLVLDTPAHFGNGDTSALMDMPILRDAVDHGPVLTGASIAGALRARLAQADARLARQLFGDLRGTHADESALIVHDAHANLVETELRDHVRIETKTRTVSGDGKFDMEVIPAGTRFSLRFELLRMEHEKDLPSALAFALAGLQPSHQIMPDSTAITNSGVIGLGKRKTRGFGRCHVAEWRVCRWQMNKRSDLLAWIRDDLSSASTVTNISDELGTHAFQEKTTFVVCTDFAIDGSLLIRSEGVLNGQVNSPDLVPLKSQRGSTPAPIISGTSLAGVLRGRALRIAKMFNPQKADVFVDEVFGTAKESSRDGAENQKKLHISRLRVSESVIEHPLEMVHTRVRIDAFTGGAFPSGLFSEQPVFGKANDQTRSLVTLELREPDEAHVGLILLLLKDLWTGDLSVGGESSVGRGRLKGKQAVISFGAEKWAIEDGKTLKVQGDSTRLEKFVEAFVKRMAA